MWRTPIVLRLFFLSYTQSEVIFFSFIIASAFAAKDCLSMLNNLLIVSRNVVYKNLENTMKADVIELDTTTKDTKIFMYNSNEQVNVTNIK